MASPAEEKVRLFRALFRGREDVYARRYTSAKTGKSGYSPVCAAEWARGLCDKKRVACAVCPNRRFVQLDDEAVRKHLRGIDEKKRDFTLGVYPLLADDTVRFAAIDLDAVQSVRRACSGERGVRRLRPSRRASFRARAD